MASYLFLYDLKKKEIQKLYIILNVYLIYILIYIITKLD